MGDTANGSWNSQELGGHVRREEARKGEQGAGPQHDETLTAQLLAQSAASKYFGTKGSLRTQLTGDLTAMYMAGFQSATKRGYGWELFGPDGALVERTAQLIAHRSVGNEEHDPTNGKISGYCAVCGVGWPCVYAGVPPVTP